MSDAAARDWSTVESTPLHTPLFPWHQEHGGRIVDFAGWAMPVQYDSIVTEHLAARQAAGLFDVSHMGRLMIVGPAATAWLEGLLTRRVADLPVGRARYTLVTGVDPDASSATGAAAAPVILDDALVTRFADAENGAARYMLVVNASNRQRVVDWLQSRMAETGVTLTDISAATAMIAVQGPAVFAGTVADAGILRSILSAETVAAVTALPTYAATEATIGGQPAMISRTGYTGEDGVELVVDASQAIDVWERLLQAGASQGVRPCGLGCRDTLRLEAAMPLYGHELNERSNPFAIGLGLAINLEGRDFPGAAGFAASRESVGQRRVGLQFESRRAARQGDVITTLDGNVCGEVTSGSFAPTVGCGVALAMVDGDEASTGTQLEVIVRQSRLSARVVPLPFYRRPRQPH